ncbi:hypothetical protein [Fodinicola acaciae]|uniref:hypothetical protein n=1 Tax=Fodinicola acaciae TaxID=2681555 RepID=UPI0013D1BF9D|nr:hypothetical protein [Fodinicola acaciae]
MKRPHEVDWPRVRAWRWYAVGFSFLSTGMWGLAGWLALAYTQGVAGATDNVPTTYPWYVEAVGAIAVAVSGVAAWAWLRGRDLVRKPSRMLPLVGSYAWRMGLVLLAYPVAILPMIGLVALVGVAFPDYGGGVDGDSQGAIVLMGWLAARFAIAGGAGVAAMVAGTVVPVNVVAVRAAITRQKDLMPQSLLAISFDIVALLVAVIVVPDLLPRGLLDGLVTLALVLVLAAVLVGAMWLGLRAGSRPWYGDARPTGRPMAMPLRQGWPMLAVRLVAAAFFLVFMAFQVLQAFGLRGL